MADAQVAGGDALSLLRQAISQSTLPVSSKSTSPDDQIESLASATHLVFISPTSAAFPLESPTRFIGASGEPSDLRSIFFAWQHKDDPIPEYIASAETLNAALAEDGAAGGTIHHLPFVERLDLITWLEGSSNESEYIKPSQSDAAGQPVGGFEPTTGAAPGTTAAAATATTRPAKSIDPRLREIYNNERRMGDRNTVLRGIKPTDFSHVRKSAEAYLKSGKSKSGPGQAVASGASASLVSLPKGKPSRRQDPIILLSPSASSLLRMSNVKSFLDQGAYIPPDSSSLAASTSILYMSRLLPSIDATRPFRFILVDSPEQFKPDYWNRLVAVFTTGQAWQFKGYKWQSPQDLFSHVLGIYLGWRGENVPDTVKGWGRGVASLQVEKYRGESVGRWRDREVVEGLWNRIEESMRRLGWSSEGPMTR